MKRISTATAVNNKFVDGDKSTGQKSTQLNAEWFNQVQEEICKLLEAAGITVGADDADNQLMQLFTSLFVLQATLKSATCKKSFEGGYSTVTVDGEKISMSAAGDNVTDNSSLNITRLLQKYQRSISGGGAMSSEITPAGVVVKVESNQDAVQIEILNDRILFKSGDPLAQHASIVYDSTTGNLTITGIGGITLGDRLYAALGLVGDLETDSITPATTDTPTPVEIGSAAGGVKLVGHTTGFVGEVTTNLIKVDDPDYPILANAILKAPNLPNDFVEISSNLDPEASRAILLNSLWSLGTVKRIFNKDSSDHTMWIFTDDQGSNLSITIPRNSYVNLACIGFYDYSIDNKTYAVTVYN